MAKVRCPSCKAAVEASGGPGAVVDCDECGKKFRLAAPKAAAAVAGAPKRSAAPPDDEDDDDPPPIPKPKKKKARKKSGGVPIWIYPLAGVTVLSGLALAVVFMVKTYKTTVGFDPMRAITDDVDSVAVIRPKGVSGASGISSMAETMKGGGSHYAPSPPEGFGVEDGHVTQAIQVKKGLKSFYIISAYWKARPSTEATATHRGVPIREDKPKHLEKPRYVVAGGSAMALFDTMDDAKAGIDVMLDSKKQGFVPDPKAAAFFTRTPGKMQEIFTTGMGPEIAKPKTVYVELSYKDHDYSVTYTLDYGTPEAVAAALKSIEECNKKVREEIAEFWKKNPDQEGNPFEKVDRLMHREKVAEGGKLIFRIPFSNVSSGPSMPLINECFRMGDKMWSGAEDLLGGMRK